MEREISRRNTGKGFHVQEEALVGLAVNRRPSHPVSLDHSAVLMSEWRNSTSGQSWVLLLSLLYDPEGGWFKNL
jgi:hypothetical protein